MHIHCFQHAPYETPGSILEWAHAQEHTLSYTRYYTWNYSYDGLQHADLLLAMGGAMNVDDDQENPWLREEKEHIKSFIYHGGKVLGICLGSQLIVSALGGKVYPARQKEIRFFPVEFMIQAQGHAYFSAFPKSLVVFHWHSDTFDLPKEAQLIASSEGTVNQAYTIGKRIAGFQFHPEATEKLVTEMLQHDGEEVKEESRFIQSANEIETQAKDAVEKAKGYFFEFLNRFTATKI